MGGKNVEEISMKLPKTGNRIFMNIIESRSYILNVLYIIREHFYDKMSKYVSI